MAKPAPGTRADYRHFVEVPTRWMDNDIYGHVNNVVYYSFFDTIIARALMEDGGLDPWRSTVIGFAVKSGCSYFKPIAFPDLVVGGLRAARIGRSSVTYEVGIFKNDEDAASAEGHFVHVFVERATQAPAPIPDKIRAALEAMAK